MLYGEMSQGGHFLKYFELVNGVWLKDLKGIFRLDPKNDQTALWKTKGRTAAIGIFAVVQPWQFNHGKRRGFLSPPCRG